MIDDENSLLKCPTPRWAQNAAFHQIRSNARMLDNLVQLPAIWPEHGFQALIAKPLHDKVNAHNGFEPTVSKRLATFLHGTEHVREVHTIAPRIVHDMDDMVRWVCAGSPLLSNPLPGQSPPGINRIMREIINAERDLLGPRRVP